MRRPTLAHLVGLAYALGLLALAWWSYGEMGRWVRGTWLADMPLLAWAVATFAVLTLAEKVWGRISARLAPPVPSD